MSLRAFHIVFIIVTVALSLYVALWGFREFARERNGGALALAIVFLIAAVALVIYGKKAFAKLKEWNTKGYFNPGFLNVDPATNMQLVYQSKAAMVLEADFVEGEILNSTKAKPESGFNVFVFPSINGSPPSVVGGGRPHPPRC